MESNRTSTRPGPARRACVPVYEQFDVAEMSLSWYAMAEIRGEPVYALPIFPLRMFIHPYIYRAPNSGIAEPRDLIGKRVGMDRYRLTVGLWARGILQEHHGVSPEQIHWVTGEPEGAGFEAPADLALTLRQQGRRAASARRRDRCADLAQRAEVVPGGRQTHPAAVPAMSGRASRTISTRPASSRSPTPWWCAKSC